MPFRPAIATAMLGALAALGPALGGDITLQVVDGEGLPQECWVRVFRAQNGGSDYASAFHGLEAKGLSPGVYNFELIKGKHVSDVMPPIEHAWLRTSGEVGVIDGPKFAVIVAEWANVSIDTVGPLVDPPTIEGLVEPRPEGQVWIRFNPVYGDYRFDVPVDSMGAFRVWGDLNGRYLLTVIRGPEILATQMVSFRVRRGPLGRHKAARMVIKPAKDQPEIMRVEQSEK